MGSNVPFPRGPLSHINSFLRKRGQIPGSCQRKAVPGACLSDSRRALRAILPLRLSQRYLATCVLPFAPKILGSCIRAPADPHQLPMHFQCRNVGHTNQLLGLTRTVPVLTRAGTSLVSLRERSNQFLPSTIRKHCEYNSVLVFWRSPSIHSWTRVLRVGPLNLISWTFFASQTHERALAS